MSTFARDLAAMMQGSGRKAMKSGETKRSAEDADQKQEEPVFQRGEGAPHGTSPQEAAPQRPTTRERTSG